MTAPSTPTTPPAGPSPVAWDRVRMLQLIEDAERETRRCMCGSLLQVVVHGDVLVLECSAYRTKVTGPFARLRGGIRTVLHDRRVVTRGLLSGD
ncbi:MAG: hypothetical protein KF809_10200 [Chloroflexi bacterium]|nr:hypothetical protein [Chloroflexota bacterium]